ncbi:MAG: high frequency lysogenization protein HflD [Vibrio sp.]
MAYSLYDRTIAFAGICQAVELVQQTARNGRCDQDALEASLKTIINMNPSSTLNVYGDESQLKLGLETFVKKIDGSDQGRELTRYLVSLLNLERKLASRQDAMSQLGDRIDLAGNQVNHYPLTDPQMISNLANIYLDVISPLGARIQIAGSPEILKLPENQHQVRALLLAGIRSAVLWRQVGGSRFQLLFGRKKMLQQAQILLARM